MRRTATDFAREAPTDGPYELEVGSGAKARAVTPKSIHDLTRGEQLERARLETVWTTAARSVQDGTSWPPRTASGALEIEASEFLLRARFGALTPHEPTDDDPRTLVATQKHPDFDAFWAQWVVPLPWEQVARAMRELDEYYNPAPGTTEERAVAAAADLLDEARAVLGGAAPDDARVSELLGRIETVAEKARAAAGKSSSAAG